MAVTCHDQSAAVLVTELHADREVIEAELKQLRCAKVAQVMPPDVRDASRLPLGRDPRRRTDDAPAVVMAPLSERVPAR